MSAHRRGRHRRRGLDAAWHHITVNLWELYYLIISYLKGDHREWCSDTAPG